MARKAGTAAKAEIAEKACEPTVELVDTAKAAEVHKKYKVKKKTFGLDDYVTVRNGYNGTLVYKSARTGEVFKWSEFGGEQEMQMHDLKSAKNSDKAFFENNWFMFDDPDVIEYLGVGMYYKNALTLDGFDELFKMQPNEIEERVKLLSKGQKSSVANRARKLIADGEIDSIKAINALEKSLGVELIER